MAEKCPFCDEYQSETLTGLCNHVRQKHDIKDYQARGMLVKDIIASKRKANEERQRQISEELRKVEEAAQASVPVPPPLPPVVQQVKVKVSKKKPVEKVEEKPILLEVKAEEPKPEPIPEPKETMADNLEFDPEQAYNGVKSRFKRMRDKPHKERPLFSTAHPAAFGLAANLLPKLGLFALAIILISDALQSMMVGDFMFVLDWYEATIIGPILMGIFLFPGGPGEWFNVYGAIASVIVTAAIVVLFVFYRTVWRFLFKDYSIVRGQSELREGRVYWWTGNVWTRMWDNAWGSPERTEHILYIKQYFWPPFNPLNPRGKLIKLHLSREEELEYDSMFSITGKERRYRVYIGDNELKTTDIAQEGREIPIDSINTVFGRRRESLIGDTQKFSMANPQVRLDLLRDGTYLIPEDTDDAATVPAQTG